MIPKLTRGGSSFKGAFRYYLHDKGADTQNRIEWFHTENMLTTDPQKAWRVMAYTAKSQERLKEASGQSRAGRKLEKPVFAFSLAWHPEQQPTPEHMLTTAREAIRTLGLEEHEAVIVSHGDEPQKHVHVIVNRVHPISGKAGDVRNSKRKFSDFALAYEEANGKIYCEQRQENFQKRREGKSTRYRDPHIVAAWQSTNNGTDFVAALAAHGYRLAQGRKRLVVIDPHGKALNPVRNLVDVKAYQFLARLRDLDFDRLPDAKKAFATVRLNAPGGKIGKPIDQLAKIRRDTQVRHQQEHETALGLHERRVRSAKRDLARFYELPERKQQLVQLKRKIALAPWWKNLLGLTKKDRFDLREQAMAYNTDLASYREKVAKVREKGLVVLADLEKRQQKEMASIKLHLDWREAGGEKSRLPTKLRDRLKAERTKQVDRQQSR